MQPQTVNYSIKHIQASAPVNTPNLAADVFNWMPGPFECAKVHMPVKEFNLNQSLFKDHVALNNSQIENPLKGEFVGIQ